MSIVQSLLTEMKEFRPKNTTDLWDSPLIGFGSEEIVCCAKNKLLNNKQENFKNKGSL